MRGRLVAGLSAGLVITAVALRLRLSRYVVAGPSMEPSLSPGDRLLVLRGPAWLLRPPVGAVIVARPAALDGREVIKRIVAVQRGRRYVVRGDNPDRSTDSRHFGALDGAEIAGCVLLRYWPDQRRGRLPSPPADQPSGSATRPSA